MDGVSEDIVCASEEIAKLLCNYVGSLRMIEEDVVRSGLGHAFSEPWRLMSSWVSWAEADEFAALFDLEVKEYEGD